MAYEVHEHGESLRLLWFGDDVVRQWTVDGALASMKHAGNNEPPTVEEQQDRQGHERAVERPAA